MSKSPIENLIQGNTISRRPLITSSLISNLSLEGSIRFVEIGEKFAEEFPNIGDCDKE
jgi:hypothetical protein